MAGLLTKLKPTRRWAQVSLRAVLVLVTLLCVALSLWVVPAERQRRAFAAIKGLGRCYWKQRASDAFPFTVLRRRLPPDYFYEVERVYFDHSRVTDAEMVYVRGFAGLRVLGLSHTQVTDAGLVHLHGLTSLRALHLDGTQVTNAGVTRLRQMLPSCEITGP
ncbi:MAG TPA: hypothetical protein VG826_14520 [Pirellulales bacterium]|nr:hypothetical protein [Pirellulales bacterium]